MMKKLFTALFLMLGIALPACAANDNPVDLVRDTSRQVLDILKQENGKNTAKIRDQVEALVLPKFDFRRMTALALGKNWRVASPDQQNEMTAQFQLLLIRTYSSTMTRFKNAQVDVKPSANIYNNGQEASVHSDIALPNSNDKKTVSVDYILYRTAQGWRVYNINVEGASLVTVYRNQFDADVRAHGIDGLIKSLKDKNGGKGA
ncbi:MlaC/ttg2D family ABC transporter substrate-binding protein [Paludibacterium paludis]|uniref:Toluene tolerance family protein n=1 Tax=Paludibacterium paludis TaxID=1225769 RepID=A0A918P626_9NEIS|nr:ABC transporter substrate-binding protein [Paludibacterium paludis]GGY29134.1 toluene tolerance family protein [Paludibacterium paludis]